MAARNTVMGEGRNRRSQMKQKKRANRETEHFFGGVISKDKRLEDKIRYEEYQRAKQKYEAKQAAKMAADLEINNQGESEHDDEGDDQNDPQTEDQTATELQTPQPAETLPANTETPTATTS